MASHSCQPFECQRCGACCRGPGQVALLEADVKGIAAHLGISVRDFTNQYTRLADNRAGLVLAERPDGACVFLTANHLCAIHEAKPLQCRQFPIHWQPVTLLQRCQAIRLGQPFRRDVFVEHNNKILT